MEKLKTKENKRKKKVHFKTIGDKRKQRKALKNNMKKCFS